MDTALKEMFALRQTRDLQLAALKDTSPGHRDDLKPARTFGNRLLSMIEGSYETAPEFRHLGEGVRLSTLIDYDKGGSFSDGDFVGLVSMSTLFDGVGIKLFDGLPATGSRVL